MTSERFWEVTEGYFAEGHKEGWLDKLLAIEHLPQNDDPVFAIPDPNPDRKEKGKGGADGEKGEGAGGDKPKPSSPKVRCKSSQVEAALVVCVRVRVRVWLEWVLVLCVLNSSA